MLVALIAPALADLPLLYVGEERDAVAVVSQDARQPAWDLEPQQVQSLLSTPGPVLVGAVTVTPCAGGALHNRELLETFLLADKQLLNLDYTRARQTAEAALNQLGCLNETADNALIGRLFLTLGLALLGDGLDPTPAWVRARQFDPTLTLSGPPDVRQRFEAISLPPPTVSLHLGPGLANNKLQVDGQRQDAGVLSLTPGAHFIQLEAATLSTFQIELQGEAMLLRGDALSDALLLQLHEEENQAVLRLLLQAAHPNSAALVWNGAQTWCWSGQQWSALPRELPPSSRGPEQVIGGSRAAMVFGGVAAVTGGVLMASVYQPPQDSSTGAQVGFRQGVYATALPMTIAGGMAIAGGALGAWWGQQARAAQADPPEEAPRCSASS